MPVIVQCLLAAAGGYLLGSLSPAAWVARARGVDIAQQGSGNPGATNVARVLGRGAGALVLLLDVAKGAIPVLLAERWFGLVPALVAGLAAVLGHVTSPWLRGHGGRGVATSLGALLAVEPWWALAALGVFAVVLAVGRRVAVASAAAAVAVPVASAVALVRTPQAERGDAWAEVAFALALAGLVLWRHRRRLLEVLRPPPSPG